MNLDKKIFLCNNILNGRRYIQSLNLNNEIILNYEVLTLRMLIENNILDYRLIDDNEAAYILFNLIKKNKYKSKDINTIGAVKKLLIVLNDYRMNESNDYSAIYEMEYDKLLNDYYNELEKNHLLDYICGLYKLNEYKFNSKLYLLNDLELTKLENKIIHNIFNDINNINPIKSNNNYCGFYNCYGIYNEILNVLDIIDEKKLPINNCSILYTNDIYENFIRAELDNRNIKYSMSSAHAKSTNIISFILDVLDYFKNNFRYDYLERILKNKGLNTIYLDEFYSTFYFPEIIVGETRERTKLLIESIKNDQNKQNLYEFLNDLIDIYDNQIDYDKLIDFSFKYINSKLEILSLQTKIRHIKYILNYDNSIDTIIDELSNLKYSESDTQDGLVISKINKLISLRKHLFIIGLSQNYMNIISTENPFIIDVNKYDNILGNDKTLHLMKNLKLNIEDNLNYCLNNSNVDIYMSYSSYNKIDFRPSAPSIYFLNKYNEYKNDDNKIIKINRYDIFNNNIKFNEFDINIDENELEIDDYNNGNITLDIESNNKHIDENIDEVIIKKDEKEKRPLSLSPSALSSLISCPYKYYYQYLKKINDVSYPKLNEYEWLEANNKGTFFHRIMELYVNNEFINNKNYYFNQKIYDECFKKAIDEITNINLIKNKTVYKNEIDDMKKLTISCINDLIVELNENRYQILACEYDLKKLNVLYKNIILSGVVDRIDGYLDNQTLHLRIIDYKTGKYHTKDKNTYLQHIFYPFIILNSNQKLFDFDYEKIIIDSFVYFYPFASKSNIYMDEEIRLKDEFERIDEIIIPYLNNEKYLENMKKYEDDISCDYCNYHDICFKFIRDGK